MRSKVKFDFSDFTVQTLRKYTSECDRLAFIQDTVHIGTKLRNRLLKAGILLAMGSKIVSVTHIKMLLNSVSKEIHGLVMSDICPEDRQNFGSLKKIMSSRVLTALKEHVFGSEGTIKYLHICDQVTSSFLDDSLSPIERLYRIWNAVFFLRVWRKWLIRNGYNSEENYITQNAYTCIEINAHMLIFIIENLRSSNQPELFLPHLFASQPCEHIFRQMRSMGTWNYTKISFNLFELLHLISRVDLMSEIIFSRLNGQNVSFPRSMKTAEIQAQIDLPSRDEIIITIKNAQLDALKSAGDFGMFMHSTDISECELNRRFSILPTEELRNETEDDPNVFNEYEEVSHNKFIEVVDEDGVTKLVRKSELVWILTESKNKISSDRLKRVQDSTKCDHVKRRKVGNSSDELIIFKADEIEIGRYVISIDLCSGVLITLF